jgi:MoaA/NifB/PqqE/SkfB family radical SAM enzyme
MNDRVDPQKNRRALGDSYVERNEISTGLPVYLVIESTSICNLKCVMCPYPTMGRKHEHMKLGLYGKIVSEAAGFVEFMWLHLFGEPLLNPDIYRMIDMAEEAGIRVGLSTNATVLNEAASRRILDSRLSLLILCMDGATKETFERIRVGAKFEEVSRNIRQFAELKRSRTGPLKAVLQMVNMHWNASEQQALRCEWEREGLDGILFKPFHVWANQDEQLISVGQPAERTSAGAVCYEPWIGFTVLADGTVVPCCNDYAGRQPLGDLKYQSIREIWNGAELMKLRRMFADPTSDRQGTICHGCPFQPASWEDARFGSGPFDPVTYQHGHYSDRGEMPVLNADENHVVTLGIVSGSLHVEPHSVFECSVAIDNHAGVALRSAGQNPIHISYHWLDAAGCSCVVFDGERTQLLPPLAAGGRSIYGVKVRTPEDEGTFRLQLCLVQENVRWLDDQVNSLTCEVEILKRSRD